VSDTTNTTYEQAVDRLMSLADFERGTHSPGHGTFHLQRMTLLLDRLGNPHLSVPTVHVAGTKGKGSTAAMITAILTAQGYKTGLYTSPALHSVTERIRVGLEPIARADFAALVERMWPDAAWVAENGDHGDVTFFEFITAMAFLHFAQIGADFQVIEVGLGGRLDATNVVSPAVSVITPIMLDHVAILGDTVELIAAEKAGIIKQGVPVVTAPQDPAAMDVFAQVSAEHGARLIRVGDDVQWQERESGRGGQSFDITGSLDVYKIQTSLIGSFQQENAATAVAAVETLAEGGVAISTRGIVDGLAAVKWPGRLQVLPNQGAMVVVDGAHNPDSMQRLVKEVERHFQWNRLYLVFGATAGHSAEGMLTALARLSPIVIPVQSRHPKAAAVKSIVTTARDSGLRVEQGPTAVGEAVRRALGEAGEQDLVLATGSISVAAEVIEEIEGVAFETYRTINMPQPGAV
jgi:dihydrofolate synthase / folylpolyglutamate synthase